MALPFSCVALDKTLIFLRVNFVICKMRIFIPFLIFLFVCLFVVCFAGLWVTGKLFSFYLTEFFVYSGHFIKMKSNNMKIFVSGMISFVFWLNNIPLYACTTFCFQSSLDEYLGCLHFLAVRNNAGVNIHVQVFLQVYILDSLGYVLRSRIAGSCGNSV